MKKLYLIVLMLAISVSAMAQDSDFFKKLATLPGVSDITALNSRNFKEKYQLFITQPIDHKNPAAGTFKQRVIVGLKGTDRPTVMVTEGYSADYAVRPSYNEELSELMNANVVFCEHRYFKESTPEPCDWNYMTVGNENDDLHNIRQTLGKVFTKKWVSTGVSKGGSTCTYYRAAYPDDVDASVAYVAPISRALEDGRHEKFLNKKVGTKEDREKMKAVQLEYMRRKPNIVKMLDTFCVNRNYHFNLPIDQIYDYEVLELEFSLWQWGRPLSQMPKNYDNDVKWFQYLVTEVGPDYFTCPSSYLPFYYQAMRELGYYGYDTRRLGKNNRSIPTAENYLKAVMVPEDMRDVKFDNTAYKTTCKFLKKNDPTHLFIYGEYDPWTSSGVAHWLNCSKKSNMKVYVQKGGSHLARIRTLSDSQRAEVVGKLKNWVGY
ncbi:MAG: aminopeptidase [Bacteroidales bacterium]|nr:aminopeptidase [Bacteroidales bacterium]